MRRSRWLILAVLAGFVLGVVLIDGSSGTDLTASYLSCRLLDSPQSSHLYAHDPDSFNLVTDPEWIRAADEGGVPRGTILSVFVQTPLWPLALRPLCEHTSFVTFNRIFVVLEAASFAALLAIVAFFWTTAMWDALWIGIVALLWLRADPLRDAILLSQTHVFFLLLTVLALLWARADREIPAGVALACAAAIKITPAALVLYWFLTGRRKAAVTCLLTLAGLLILTPLLAGQVLTRDYFDSMSRMSNMLLLAPNNQSFAAWWLGRHTPLEALSFRPYPLPAGIKVFGYMMVALATALGGWMDRRLQQKDAGIPPYGGVVAILTATTFTSLAWSHYYILLVVPLLLLLDLSLRDRSLVSLLFAVCIFLLANGPWLRRHAEYLHIALPVPIRCQFVAGILALIAMVYAAWMRGTLRTSRLASI